MQKASKANKKPDKADLEILETSFSQSTFRKPDSALSFLKCVLSFSSPKNTLLGAADGLTLKNHPPSNAAHAPTTQMNPPSTTADGKTT